MKRIVPFALLAFAPFVYAQDGGEILDADGKPLSAQSLADIAYNKAVKFSEEKRRKVQDFEKNLELAAKGDPVAQNKVGDAYAEGDIIEKNIHTAAYWWYEAATRKIPRRCAVWGSFISRAAS